MAGINRWELMLKVDLSPRTCRFHDGEKDLQRREPSSPVVGDRLSRDVRPRRIACQPPGCRQCLAPRSARPRRCYRRSGPGVPGPCPPLTPEPQTALPSAPASLTASRSYDRVTLGWDDPGDDSITGYRVLRRPVARLAGVAAGVAAELVVN